jgi:hypothetical protein
MTALLMGWVHLLGGLLLVGLLELGLIVAMQMWCRRRHLRRDDAGPRALEDQLRQERLRRIDRGVVSLPMLLTLAALLVAVAYLPPVDSSGKLLQHPERGERCWRIASCPKWSEGWSGQIICSTRGSSSEVQEWMRKRKARCSLGSEVKGRMHMAKTKKDEPFRAVIDLDPAEAWVCYQAVERAIDHYSGDDPALDEALVGLHTDLEVHIDPGVIGAAKAAQRHPEAFQLSVLNLGHLRRLLEAIERVQSGGRLPPEAVEGLELLAKRLRRSVMVALAEEKK